jgi:hypothetical protein
MGFFICASAFFSCVDHLPTQLLQVARTETAPFSKNPEFLNRVFVLRLPEPLGNSLSPQLLLHCNLFAAPSMDSTTPGMQDSWGAQFVNPEIGSKARLLMLQHIPMECRQCGHRTPYTDEGNQQPGPGAFQLQLSNNLADVLCTLQVLLWQARKLMSWWAVQPSRSEEMWQHVC